MSDSLDSQILQHHTKGATRDAICHLLHVDPNRVSRVLGFFRPNHHRSHGNWMEKGEPIKISPASEILRKLNEKGISC
jgi:hypothetical protein